MTLQEKLDLWVQITSVNPLEDKKKYTIHLDGRLSDYDIKKMNDRITETLQDDETGMFAEAYLSSYLKQFLEQKKLSLLELVNNKELSAFVDDVKRLHDSLIDTDADSIILNEAKKAMNFYGLPCDSLNTIDVIELRTSALRCINGKLQLLQFSSGNKKADSFKLSKDIYMFDNLDSLILCSAKGNLNGVTLGYIRDKEELTASFFAFIIKNGDNLYLLTDMPKYAHPVQKGMIRCPGRDMSNRINSNWFPYDTVANIDIGDLWGSGRYGTKETKDGLSTVINESSPYAVIGNIESLSQCEAFWFVMMASLIKKKFYEENLPMLPISYTRSMITSIMLEKTENALIVQNSLPSFELKEVEDIKETQDLEYEIKNEEYIGMYDYLAERYADKVDKSILNVISNTDKSKLIEDTYYKKSFGKKECYMRSLDLDNQAGTKEQIEYNLKWIARYNYANAIREEMEKDVEEKTPMLYDTIKGYITPRLEDIIKMHLNNELVGYKTKSHYFENILIDEKTPISKTLEFNKWYDNYTRYRYGYGIPRNANKADMKCHFTGKSAGVVITVKPRTAEELALVCGISIEELPEELQCYDRKTRKYTGNSILNNIDPFLSILEDEFNTLDFDIVIILSKKKYLEFCTLAGVEAVKFWQNEHPICHTSSKSDRKKDKCNGIYKRRWKNGHYVTDLAEKCKKCKWYNENITSEDEK